MIDFWTWLGSLGLVLLASSAAMLVPAAFLWLIFGGG